MRMLGDVAQSWCPSCHCPPGPDCPDTGKTTRAAKRREQRVQQRSVDDLVAEWRQAAAAAARVPGQEYQ
jgi:hypothetical protein